MSSASTIGDSIAPHGCWSGGVITGGSSNVLFNGKPAASISSPGTPHDWTCSDPPPPHNVFISEGSGTVLINGKPAARIGDSTNCGSVISSGSANILIGD